MRRSSQRVATPVSLTGFWLTLGVILLVVLILLSCLVLRPSEGQAWQWPSLAPSPTPLPLLRTQPPPLLPLRTWEARVQQQFPVLPAVPSRYDIRPRLAVVQAIARETTTEPFVATKATVDVANADHEEEEETELLPPPPEDHDFVPTKISRTLQLLDKLKTLPKMKALQTIMGGGGRTHTKGPSTASSSGEPPLALHRGLEPPLTPPTTTTRLPPRPPRENRTPPAQEKPLMDEPLTHEAVQEWVATRSLAPPSARNNSHKTRTLKSPAVTAAPSLTEMIELVLYINQNEHRFQRQKIEKELTRVFRKEDRIETLRVLGEKRDDAMMAKLLSHVAALSLACESQRNVLVLEDTFKFYVSRDELQDHLQLVQREFGDRWNVVVLGATASSWAPVEHGTGNNMQLMRILQGNFTSGYLVNRTYIPVLLNLMIEHIYVRYPDPQRSDSVAADLQERLHLLQSQDVWLGFQSPVGGLRNETLDELAVLTGTEEKSRWTVRKHGVYVKATEKELSELNNLLRHLYLERYKGHRLSVAVHHPPGQKLAHRHKRSFSSTFYEGVKYFSDPQEVETYLQEFEAVQWIDLTAWCQSEDTFNRLFLLLDDKTGSVSGSSDEESGSAENASVASSEPPSLLPCWNAQQRHQILSAMKG